MNLSEAQTRAVCADGNILVSAGAGSGKTRVLVERCLARLLDSMAAASIHEILVVTFTEAAAAEIKQRIRLRLSQELDLRGAGSGIEEQLALLDTAPISTLHSFCFKLAREHFYELQIDPQLSVLTEAQSAALKAEILDDLLQDVFAGKLPFSAALQNLMQTSGRRGENEITRLAFELHEFTQTRPHPEQWLARERMRFEQPLPADWFELLEQGLGGWFERWQQVFAAAPVAGAPLDECAELLRAFARPALSHQPEKWFELLEKICAADGCWPRGTKGKSRAAVAEFFDDAEFWLSLLPAPGSRASVGPLQEDWDWVRPSMIALVQFAEEFARRHSAAKRELGAADFHDLEQFALRLLVEGEKPTALATQVRQQFKFVMVDEYQDINPAQDRILQALSRDGVEANRFLVGDVKQSIYRFRQAEPRIFSTYEAEWKSGPAFHEVIPLSENYRSREALLDFANSFFRELMRSEAGGLGYDANAELQFGARDQRRALSREADQAARVEIHFCCPPIDRENRDEEEDAASAAADDATVPEREARLVAGRLAQLKNEGYAIWDDALKSERPVQWKDMVVLLRAPSGKAEIFAKEFAKAGVPLQTARGGLYETVEIRDLLSLLQLLDNPLQDIPLLAVLRSPLVGLSVDELAEIRLTLRRHEFWTALQRFHQAREKISADGPQRFAWPKVDRFLERFSRWRMWGLELPLSEQLQMILAETNYLEWVESQGPGRGANVRRLLALARQFDPFQRQGLQRFLRYVEAEQNSGNESEPAALETADAVRLTSIHRSKGLEFPIVVVADLGKAFNFSDLTRRIILDDEHGLCPQIQPPGAGQRYPSLPYWLAAKRQRKESVNEELRLLYVAMTRARDLLLLVGSISKRACEKWELAALRAVTPEEIVSSKRALDWVGPWMVRQVGSASFATGRGETTLFRWRKHEAFPVENSSSPPAAAVQPDASGTIFSAELSRMLQERVGSVYPHQAATWMPAKTSVSVLRRNSQFTAEEAANWSPHVRGPKVRPKQKGANRSSLSASEIGTAHHLFMQFYKLNGDLAAADLEREGARLMEEGVLQPEQRNALDFDALRAFWISELGQSVRSSAQQVQRELPFTVRLSPAELTQLRFLPDVRLEAGDFLVVQGVVDLAVVRAQEIWIVDFKTDRISVDETAERSRAYQSQLQIYGLALARILRRPVTRLWLHFLMARQTISIPSASIP